MNKDVVAPGCKGHHEAFYVDSVRWYHRGPQRLAR